MPFDESAPDSSVVPRSATGLFLCGERCALNDACQMGILAARLVEGDNTVSFDVECPVHYGRITPNLAHVSWTAGIMSEMCGSFPLYLGVMAFAGTVTTRFQAPVPVGERLIGRATLEKRERRKLFVDATLTSSATGAELAIASGIAIEMRGPEDPGTV